MEKLFKKTANKAEELTKLLDQLINYPISNIYGKTALHFASEKGNLMMVKFLINGGAQVNAKEDYMGQTPLHYAYSSEVAKYLIDSGSEIESKDNNGYTPLLLAVAKGKIDTVKCLIENGADVEAAANTGKTTIHTAAVRPRWVEELSIWISFSHFYPFLLQSQQSPGVTGGLGLASLK